MRSNWCGALCIVHRCDVQTGMVLCILYIGVMYKLVWCSVYFTLVSCINWCGALCIVHRCDVQTGMVLCILYIGVMYKLVWCSLFQVESPAPGTPRLSSNSTLSLRTDY